MVTQPINAQGVEFNIQYYTWSPHLVINQGEEHGKLYLLENDKVMRQRFECI